MSPELLVSPTWGQPSDTLPVSPPLLTPALNMQLNDASENKQHEKDDKLPHDASVFVGSLPSNIDQGDLTRMLMDHLSEHTQIKNIKVVRDSKGGVCAFVQCENATSATALIQTLHSSVPKPFLGRILRYEPARAFRSLLISYRTPTQLVGSHIANTPSVTNAQIELDLPDAMRIWKHRTSRFHSILYNSEAKQAEEDCDRIPSDGPPLDNILFLEPLKFDEDTLQRIASYFGSLEMFAPLKVATVDDVNHDGQGPTLPFDSYPELHRAPRSPSMDTSCWEVKWEHRDDCVSALMTLRRVPHLTVTWAHQPASFGLNHPNHHQNVGPPSYPFHTHRRPLAFPPLVPKKSNIVPKFQRLGQAHDDLSDEFVISQSKPPFPGLFLEQDGADRELTYRSWADEPTPSTGIKELDSPNALEQEKNGAAARSQSRSEAREYSFKGSDAEQCGDDAKTGETGFDRSLEAGVQELCMPPTPALDSFTVTPVSQGSQFPITPTSSGADIPLNISRKRFDTREPPSSFKAPRPGREIDPTTLFVGGLEMFGSGAWDEEKVRVFFSRFGGLESVKLVRPLNACAAFAFVKFDNAEAPARAVFEEHNRVYEGRAMRVQLRDCNPPRNNWKFIRGRGRPYQHHFGVPRKLNYRPSFGGQERGSFHVNGVDNMPFPNVTSEIQLSSLADALPARDRTPKDGIPSTSGSTGPTSLSLDNASISGTTPPTDKYREWYDDSESPARTPEPSSLGSSASTAGMSFSSPFPYAMPNGPYLPPPPWMHPYSPHGPFQMPYYPGYPVYAPTTSQQPHQVLTTPPGSDVGGPTTPAQHNWPPMGMYTSYIPYPAIASRTQAIEQGQPSQPHMAPQAPVVPTGFIQNEQGTLVAVYQPDVLDQYFSGSGPPPTSMAQYSSSTQQRWDYPPPQVYEPGNSQRDNFPHTTPTQNRMKTTGFSAPPQQFSAPQRGMEFNATSYHRSGGGRREAQHAYGPVRQHTHPRSFNNGRPTRAHPAHIHADTGHPTGQSARPGEWNRWDNAP